MNINEKSLISDLSLIISLIPFIFLIDRTIRVNGLDILLMVYSGIICIICFLVIWLLSNLKLHNFNFLQILGLIISLGGLIIWFFSVELVSIYVLGTLILFLSSMPSVTIFNKDDNLDDYSLSAHLFLFFSISLMCFSTSFLISIFLWDNLVIYIIIGLESLLIGIHLNEIRHSKEEKSLKEQNIRNKSVYYIKHLLLFIFLLIIPIGFIIVIFLISRGYLFYLPFSFGTIKLLSAIILASLSLIFSFFFQKVRLKGSS